MRVQSDLEQWDGFRHIFKFTIFDLEEECSYTLWWVSFHTFLYKYKNHTHFPLIKNHNHERHGDKDCNCIGQRVIKRMISSLWYENVKETYPHPYSDPAYMITKRSLGYFG